MSKRKSDEQALAHGVLSVGHVLQCRLLIMNLFVLSHIGFIAKVIKVASVRLRVELRNEGSTLSSEASPINLSKILMRINILDSRETFTLRGNAAIGVSYS